MIDKEARELLLELADGDIGKAKELSGLEVIEFWGYVWQFQERNKKKLKNYKDTTNGSESRPDSVNRKTASRTGKN